MTRSNCTYNTPSRVPPNNAAPSSTNFIAVTFGRTIDLWACHVPVGTTCQIWLTTCNLSHHLSTISTSSHQSWEMTPQFYPDNTPSRFCRELAPQFYPDNRPSQLCPASPFRRHQRFLPTASSFRPVNSTFISQNRP